MPWKLMSEKPQSVDRSLLLDYVSDNPLAVLSRAVWRRHLPVVASAMGSMMIILVTVFSTGLFVLQPESMVLTKKISMTSTLDQRLSHDTGVDNFPVLFASSMLSGNLSLDYPPGTFGTLAVETFSVPGTSDGQFSRKFQATRLIASPDHLAYQAAYVMTFTGDLGCNLGGWSAVYAAWNETLTIWANLTDFDNCTTGFTWSVSPKLDDESGARQLVSFGKAILQQCPGNDQQKLFIVFGQLDVEDQFNGSLNAREVNIHSFNASVLVCTPIVWLQIALVMTDSAENVFSVDAQTNPRANFTSWGLWSAFDTSLQAAAPTLLEGSTVSLYPEFSYDDFFSTLLATYSRQPAEYLDVVSLQVDSMILYEAATSLIINKQWRIYSLIEDWTAEETQGVIIINPLRVILRGPALRITEAGIAMIIICACLVVIISPCPSVSSGTTLVSLAVTVQQSGLLKSQLQRSGKMSLDHIRDSLSGRLYSSISHGLDKFTTIQLHEHQATPPISVPVAETDIWWRPLVFSMYMKIAVLILPLIIAACLEATYQISHQKHGLDDAPVNQYWHYAWTWIPALTMTLVSLLYSSLTWSVALLDPYSILRTTSVAAQPALSHLNLSNPSIQLFYQGLRLKRYALIAASVSAILAPFLTIIVSGLILVQPTLKTEGRVVPLVDHISSPDAHSDRLSIFTDWNQASLWAANLLYQGYATYPKGSYKNFVFPVLDQDISNATTGTRPLNVSSIEVDVGVVLSNMSCEVMDPAGFRYFVISNGSDYLNFTHVDLAGYKCEDLSPQCDKGIMSIGGLIKPNNDFYITPHRFEYVVYQDNATQPSSAWANPSSWNNSDILRQAIAARNETTHANPDVAVFYGSYDTISARIRNLTGISCYYDIRQGRANVTYDFLTQAVTSVQPANESFVTISNYLTPWNGAHVDVDVHLEALLPNGSLWQTLFNNSSPDTYDSHNGSIRLATQLSDLYNTFFTQYYNTVLRDQNFTADTTHANAIVYDKNWQRIFQSAISTRILQGLLLAMWLCAFSIFWQFDTKTLLPKNPCSIAAQASLLADSKFLDLIPEGAQHATLRELTELTPFKDHLFSMGWWDDGNGGRRFGIDVGMADFDEAVDDEGKLKES
jgi:hypothetical protein